MRTNEKSKDEATRDLQTKEGKQTEKAPYCRSHGKGVTRRDPELMME